MVSHHGSTACKAIPSRQVTIVAATYGTNGQLRNPHISGPKPGLCNLPDEGVYIIFGNRALQVAAPSCDSRKCQRSQICSCSNDHYNTDLLKQRRPQSLYIREPCQGCLVNWLCLYDIAEEIYTLGMSFFQAPRTLTWTTLLGALAYHYDAQLEQQQVFSSSNFKFLSNKNMNSTSTCLPQLLDSMKGAWAYFIDCAGHKRIDITALSDSEDSLDEDDCVSDSDWDDIDVPVQPKTSNNWDDEDHDDFDTFDDIIEEEFPQLKKCSVVVNSTNHMHEDEGYASADSADRFHDNDLPAAIIPPKNMAVARALMESACTLFPVSTSVFAF